MDPVQTTQDLLDVDTSMCENYDEPGVNTARLSKISMNLPTQIKYDYFYNEDLEGTSAKNVARKLLFNEQIDHI